MAPTGRNNLALALVATASAAVAGYFLVKKIQEEKAKKAPETRIFADKALVGKNLCNYVVELAKDAIAARGVFHLAVAGGSLLDLLPGLAEKKDQVDFSKFVLAFVNHKCVMPTNEKATVAKAKSKFADAAGIVNIISPTVATPPVEGSDGTAEAAFYADVLKQAGVPHENGYPVFDLVIFGLGADGHVGSCHPMGPAVWETSKAVAGSPKEGEPSSVTLTIESMNQARNAVFVVCGGSKGKKEAVKRALVRPAEEPRGIFPAQLIQRPVFFLDVEAAADL